MDLALISVLMLPGSTSDTRMPKRRAETPQLQTESVGDRLQRVLGRGIDAELRIQFPSRPIS